MPLLPLRVSTISSANWCTFARAEPLKVLLSTVFPARSVTAPERLFALELPPITKPALAAGTRLKKPDIARSFCRILVAWAASAPEIDPMAMPILSLLLMVMVGVSASAVIVKRRSAKRLSTLDVFMRAGGRTKPEIRVGEKPKVQRGQTMTNQ